MAGKRWASRRGGGTAFRFFLCLEGGEYFMATKKKTEQKTLEQISAEIEESEKKRRYYKQREKILTRQVMPQLTRAARTNRLCTRAGMLESFLVKPELLSNDQVMELLKIAFRQKPVQNALQEMLSAADVTDPTEET